VAPRSDLERILAEVWAEVLRLPRVGVLDNFFALGGDSILTIQVVARCRERGVEVLPRQIFRHPTVAGLATVAERSTVPHGSEIAETAEIAAPEPVSSNASLPSGDAPSFPQAGLSREELADLLADLD
jgi:aryl carrier-like protein